MINLKNKIDHMIVIISSGLLALMMMILTANVILRYIPGIGGFNWYMESAQYLNVWAMMIVAISLTINDSHLSVNIIDVILKGKNLQFTYMIKEALTMIFYIGLAYGSLLLALKSRQDISTMAPLKMSYVYWMMPVTSILCVVSSMINLKTRLNDFLGKRVKS